MKKIAAALVLALAFLARRIWARTQDTAPEHAAIVTGKVAAYSGAATAITSGLTVTEWGVIVGGIVGVLGLVFSQYWAWRKDRRENAAQRRREKREATLSAAYLRRLAEGRETTPMPLDLQEGLCANDSPTSSEHRA